MNAARGSRFILKSQQEARVIQQLSAQDFERHRAVAHRDLLGEEDGSHAARSQLADQPKTVRKTRGEMGIDLSHSGRASAGNAELKYSSAALRLFPSIHVADFQNNSALIATLPNRQARLPARSRQPVHCLFIFSLPARPDARGAGAEIRKLHGDVAGYRLRPGRIRKWRGRSDSECVPWKPLHERRGGFTPPWRGKLAATWQYGEVNSPLRGDMARYGAAIDQTKTRAADRKVRRARAMTFSLPIFTPAACPTAWRALKTPWSAGDRRDRPPRACRCPRRRRRRSQPKPEFP